MSIELRAESTEDVSVIHEVVTAAFLQAAHTGHNEQYIVKALRNDNALALSIVAAREGTVIGYVALSPVAIADGTAAWYGLGPIAVVPHEQGKGVGALLMDYAISQLKKINANGCVLLGNPKYYSRFGFRVKEGLVLEGVPAEYFQARLLNGDWPKGQVMYHPAFFAQYD